MFMGVEDGWRIIDENFSEGMVIGEEILLNVCCEFIVFINSCCEYL